MKECKKVNYDPNYIWFDYQALFDKTKDKILKKDNDTKIYHADFIENNLARDAVFGTDLENGFNYSRDFLNEILNGNVCSFFFAYGNCCELLDKKNQDYNPDEIKQCKLNSTFFLVLVVSFSNKYNDARMEDYTKISKGYIPTSLKESTRNINEMNLYEIIAPLIKNLLFSLFLYNFIIFN